MGTSQFQKFTIERNGTRDLTFTGKKIGFGKLDSGPRGTEVEIYKTIGGHFVVAVCQFTFEFPPSDKPNKARRRAEVCQTLDAIRVWLEADAHGKLGRASKEAWESACDHEGQESAEEID